MKKLIPLTAVFAYAAAYAALPESPLSSQYTINTSETLTDASYEIASGGVLNVGDDTGGSGTLNVLYSAQTLVFSGGGAINIGTAETVGEFYFTGTDENFASEQYKTLMNFSGVINVNEMGSFIINGYLPSSYGGSIKIGTLNLRGTLSTPLTKSSNTYIEINNLNVYEGSNLNSSQSLLLSNGGTWNVYSSGITAGRIRVGAGVINLNGENVLKNVNQVGMDLDNGASQLTINMGDYSNVINEFLINKNSTVNINLDPAKNSVLSILKLTTKENRVWEDGDGATTVNITNFANDSIFVGDQNGVTVTDDGRIYIADKNAYMELYAYSDAWINEIVGDWYLEWNDEMGLFALNNTGAIPEPGACAAAFGVLALAYAARRRRN